MRTPIQYRVFSNLLYFTKLNRQGSSGYLKRFSLPIFHPEDFLIKFEANVSFLPFFSWYDWKTLFFLLITSNKILITAIEYTTTKGAQFPALTGIGKL